MHINWPKNGFAYRCFVLWSLLGSCVIWLIKKLVWYRFSQKWKPHQHWMVQFLCAEGPLETMIRLMVPSHHTKPQNETKYFAIFDGPLSEQTQAHLTVVNRENRYYSYWKKKWQLSIFPSELNSQCKCECGFRAFNVFDTKSDFTLWIWKLRLYHTD